MEFGEESDATEQRPLEVMILERSKSLQTENTTLRVARDKIAGDLEATKRELSESAKECERLKRLADELEDHVERLQELQNRGEAEGRSSADILVDALNDTDNVAIVMEDLQLGRKSSSASPTDKFSPGASSESQAALLPIIQAQRERFRQRNEELEAAQTNHFKQMELLKTEVADLQADNLKLYEKIRFLQGFNKGGSTSSAASSPVESRYKQQYDQKLDPFTSFSQSERQRRYGQLSVFEKIILSFVQFMMGNKMARLFVFAYSVLLHVLVFLVLMRMAYNDAYRRDLASEWHEKYVQHMQDAHGHDGVIG